jgi:hypothetical protein
MYYYHLYDFKHLILPYGHTRMYLDRFFRIDERSSCNEVQENLGLFCLFRSSLSKPIHLGPGESNGKEDV